MPKVGFISLGCPKNLVDTEVMMGLASEAGCELTADQSQADILVINTCAFIGPAKRESIETILEMAEYKKSGRCKKLIVAGCLVERYRNELQREIPEVDAVIGTNEVPLIVRALAGKPAPKTTGRFYLYDHTTPRLLATPRHSAYIKISEGCDHTCSFCIIPKLRGPHRSRAIDSILNEAEQLAASGAREINLIAQDSTRYGADIGLKDGLARLLAALAAVRGIEWIRFLYAYPNTFSDSVLEVMAGEPKVCKYVDIPLQHASAKILAAMRRGGSRRSLAALIEKIRKRVPGVAIRTTMIVGFPGETERDFQELLAFCRSMEFERLGVFAYSDEEGTAAFRLGPKVPEKSKRARRDRLMRQQAEISLRKNRELVGRRVKVLIDGQSRESDLLLEGRMESQAPEIDGAVLINDASVPVGQGEFHTVEITEAYEYDLVGRVVS